MKAVISCNYDPMYLFCLPIVTWGWNKLGAGVIVQMPQLSSCDNEEMMRVVMDEMVRITKSGEVVNQLMSFYVPTKNQEVTYTQCSRLYAAANPSLNNPEEILITSDVDMLVFDLPPMPQVNGDFCIFGHDLVPEGQFPMCYISAAVKTWRAFLTNGRPLQQCLDDLLGHINVEQMRSNYWAKDQEESHRIINTFAGYELKNRARGNTQFAANRCDRDDWFWAERFATEGRFMDAHLWRPLYTEENIEKLCGLWSMMYPLHPTDWIRTYAEKFRRTLK